MGRVKDALLRDWIEEEQEKHVEEKVGESGIIYNDLIYTEEIVTKNIYKFYIVLVNGSQHKFHPKDIIELNSVCIRYKKEIDYYKDEHITRYYTIPLDKVLYVAYDIRSANKTSK